MDLEILESLKYADANKNNREVIEAIMAKARLEKGLTHREASVLLACDIPEVNEQIFALAKQIKLNYYGNRMVLFAPLYLSNYCVNGCVYCPYHFKNKHIPRKKLSQEELIERQKQEIELLKAKVEYLSLLRRAEREAAWKESKSKKKKSSK